MKNFKQFKQEINRSVSQIDEIAVVENLMDRLRSIRQNSPKSPVKTEIETALEGYRDGLFEHTEMGVRIDNFLKNEEIDENNLVKRIFKEIPLSEVFRHGGEWFKKITKTSFVSLVTEKKYYYTDDMPDFYVYQDAGDLLGESRFQFINEDLPANSVGTAPGHVSGVSDGDTVVRKHKFGNHDLFDVDSDTFNKCRQGKKKYARWSKYINKESEFGKKIYEFATKNPMKPIVLRHKDTGIMLYARRKW